MTRTFATIATTLARPAVAALLAAGVLAGAARAQTATPSADQQACLVAKFTRANEVMDAASTQAADLFKSRYPDKAELIDAMRAADSSLRDGSLVVFKHLIATDPSKLNLRDGMGIEIAVPMFTVATELEALKGVDPSVQDLLDRGAAAQKSLEANEALQTWYREEAMPALQNEVMAFQTEARSKLAEINTQECGWPAKGAAALSDARRSCMIDAVKTLSTAQVTSEQATAALWLKAMPEQAALISAERDRKIAESEIAAIEFAYAATTAPMRLLMSPDAEEVYQFQTLMPLEIESARMELETSDPAYVEAKERRRAATRASAKLGGVRRLTYLISDAQSKGIPMDDELFRAEQEAISQAGTASSAKCPR
ncbi:MAG: hypothetical protein U1E49_15100 [Hyphomicrobiaceae bacterium]